MSSWKSVCKYSETDVEIYYNTVVFGDIELVDFSIYIVVSLYVWLLFLNLNMCIDLKFNIIPNEFNTK